MFSFDLFCSAANLCFFYERERGGGVYMDGNSDVANQLSRLMHTGFEGYKGTWGCFGVLFWTFGVKGGFFFFFPCDVGNIKRVKRAYCARG